MRLSQRQGTLTTMGIQIFGLLLSLAALITHSSSPVFQELLGITAGYTLLLVAYARGLPYTQNLMVILVTCVTGLTITTRHSFDERILIPAAVALAVTHPRWVIASALATWALVLLRFGLQSSYADPETITIYLVIVATMIVARLVTETAQREAEEHARRARDEHSQAQLQARQLTEANRQQEHQIEQQQSLISLVNSLETPTIQLADHVLLAPIVGQLDSQRAERLTIRLLQDAHAQRARLVILDIAGVSVVDTAIAAALSHTTQALRLLGCTVCLSGISAGVADTLVQLDVPLQGVMTVRSPQEALARYAP